MTGVPALRFSFVIPFFNNRLIAAECLPGVVQLFRQDDRITEIVAVDDGSTDGTAEWIRKGYPEINLLHNPRNLGFGQSCKKGIERSQGDWIILLNSDVRMSSDIITPLVDDVNRDPDLFAVGFYSFRESGERFEGRKKIKAKTGLFKTRNDFGAERTDGRLYDSLYACGGHALFSKDKFLALDGFSTVFEPFYWEDVDLSYRALKRGWRVYFDARCKVVHCHRGSIRSANSERVIKTMQTRNKMLFFWKNISSPRLWIRHVAGMMVRLSTSWIAGDIVFYRAFGAAIRKVASVTRERQQEKTFWIKGDDELFLAGQGDALSLPVNASIAR